MKTVNKYPIPPRSETGRFAVNLPVGTQVLSIETLRGEPYIWALVDSSERNEIREFLLISTGHVIEDSDLMRYVGTVSLMGHEIVFHLFELSER